MFKNLFEFYRSKEWDDFRKIVIADRIRDDGFIYDELTNKPIVKAYDIILHHIEPLTDENVFDYNISLNPANIMILSFKSHNIIHERLCKPMREVFLVYGAPLSGKSSWVNENRTEGDLVVDIDSIWQCISGCERYTKPNRLKPVAFKIRDTLLDAVKYRLGRWERAFVIGGYPLTSERERLAAELGAREILIDTPREICLERLEAAADGRNREEWQRYIDEWFGKFNLSNIY